MNKTEKSHQKISNSFSQLRDVLSLYKVLAKLNFNSKLNRQGVYSLLKKSLKENHSSLQEKLDEIDGFDNQEILLASIGGKFRQCAKFNFHNKDLAKTKTGKKTTGEKLIQRVLFLNESKYTKQLGTLFGYEVTLSSLGRGYPLDLIGYEIKGKQIVFDLIEMKACSYFANGKQQKESNQLLVSPIFEISTYAKIFEYVYKNDGDNLKKAIQKELQKLGENISGIDFDNPLIKKIVVGPTGMINELDYVEKDLKLNDLVFVELGTDANKPTDNLGYPVFTLKNRIVSKN